MGSRESPLPVRPGAEWSGDWEKRLGGVSMFQPVNCYSFVFEGGGGRGYIKCTDSRLNVLRIEHC